MKFSAHPIASGLMVCLLSSPLCVQASEIWPSKPLRFILPAQPGASADIAARVLAQQLSKTWKQPVIVDNRPGAGTILATKALAMAPPDGYTFGWVLAAHAVNPALYENLPYDTVRDFSGVTLLYALKSVIVAAPGFPANNVSELVALAKSKAGPLTFTSPLPGTVPHLLGELFKRQQDVQMQHIGYKGSVAAHIDVMAGRVQVMFDVLPNALPLIRTGKLKALAVLGDSPAMELPDVPTLPGVLPAQALAGWNGIVVPAGTPKATVDKLNADIIAAVRSPEVQQRFATLTVDTITNSPQEFDTFIRDEIARWGDVVKRAGIKLE